MLTELSSERPPPMLGILLRAPWQAIRMRIHRDLVAAGFDDVRPRDLAVLQWPGPDGMRQIDVAANANMSKQAVKPLIDHLEQCGYLDRVPDPDDHRAQRIRTTPRGKQLMRTAAAIITAIDNEIEDKLGPETNAQLRTILGNLTAITAEADDFRYQHTSKPADHLTNSGIARGRFDRPSRALVSTLRPSQPRKD